MELKLIALIFLVLLLIGIRFRRYFNNRKESPKWEVRDKINEIRTQLAGLDARFEAIQLAVVEVIGKVEALEKVAHAQPLPPQPEPPAVTSLAEEHVTGFPLVAPPPSPAEPHGFEHHSDEAPSIEYGDVDLLAEDEFEVVKVYKRKKRAQRKKPAARKKVSSKKRSR